MDPTKRIITNTAVQYVKAVITTCFSLYSTRLVLDALDINDYGIYTVIAGVVAMLGFITNALVITTQRYLSFHKSTAQPSLLRDIFANSLFIHIIFGMLIVAILISVQGFLFSHILNIPATRIHTAQQIYVITVFMLLVTILTSPFKALFIAHENITYIAVVEILDSLVKLAFAISLVYVTADRLLIYQWMVAFIVLLNLLVFSIYALVKYPECVVIIRKEYISKTHICRIAGFAGWTTYGMGCTAFRNQGTAIVLNHFFSTAVNAAYGIAFQISAAISFLVSSILNAMNPQLMQAEGAGDRRKMLSMAASQSKFTTAILSIVIIPLITEMPAILSLWLKEVPPYTSMFCRFILLAFLCDQITVGLGSANQAIGQIRDFTLLTYTPKLLLLPVSWLLFSSSLPPRSMMVLFVAIELAVALVRIPYIHMKTGLNVMLYIRSVLLPIAIHATVVAAVCWLFLLCFDSPWRFVATCSIGAVSGVMAAWFFVLNSQERAFVHELVHKLTRR